jgi:hypothetical protein
MHDVSRQIYNSVNRESGELLVSMAHLAFNFYLYEMAARVFCF